MGFTKLGLSDRIMQGVQTAGYTVPTPIQTLAILPALAGRDIIGCAQTGTGKTAAFVLPILHRLTEGAAPDARDRRPRALVLTPTRELAQQVQLAVATYGKFLSVRSLAVYGGVSMENQLKVLRRGADIIVATPGRLLDHMQRRSVDLSRVQTLVLDEADRMLDMGFIRDVRKIIAAIPAERQTMLFSATLSREIHELAALALRNPQMIEAGERRNPVETIEQRFYSTSTDAKMDLLFHALDAEAMQSVLIFSRTKHGADKICKRLERKGIASIAIHSNRTQAQRERALDGFKQGTFRVLVATDIAARGIDVTGISHVINYDIPHFAEDYIHRIGRTGRAGARGEAITFVAREDHSHLQQIEKFVGKRFSPQKYPGFTPPAHEAARPQAGSPVHAAAAAPQGRERQHPRPGSSSRSPRSPRSPHSPGKDRRRTSSSSHSKTSGWRNY